ncbi:MULTISPECIES: efflux RND transporter periplasmic adaptor subunit [unclassified Pseudomonas]|uniref:efflux RND transporter periplasmic adaptor subunit n=1 Tax=unclassified Pseudomonas TaxID=196821 RepID=UPI00029B0170|nr:MULTISPECIES: efflux RND transporter periplasmic adaptor subunit [unclassified Pseudomonas]AIB42873.1 antibiotic transporter [Pseudomonas sp. WCS374]
MRLNRVIPTAISAIALAVFLSGCKSEENAPAPAPPVVGVITVQPQDYVIKTELPGRTAPYRVAEVRPQVDGIIQRRLFKEGSDVKEGQALYSIDPAPYEATLEHAQAISTQARSLVSRYRQLVAQQAVSRQEFDDAQSKALAADADLKSAQINLRYTHVQSPISGRIGRSAVTEGALVNKGQSDALATIQQLDPIYIDITESSAALLKQREDFSKGRLQSSSGGAATVNLTLENGSVYPAQGRLEFSEVSVDPSTGSVTLRAVFPNPDHVLLPGMFVRAQLQSGVKTGAILAPQQGVTRDLKGTPSALVINSDSVVEQRVLVATRTVDNKWLVEKGLNPGDQLVTEGLQFVKPGMKVTTQVASNISSAASSAVAKGN